MSFTSAEVWEQFNQRILGYIQRRVADPDDAEDLTQEVFVKVHTRIDQLHQEDRVLPWLYQIARNTVIDYYRSRKPSASLSEELVDDSSEVEEAEPIQVLADGLQDMIYQLEVKYQQPLMLSEIQGMKQSKVAEELGLSLSGAKSRIQRGRHKLRQQLLDCCHFEFDRRGGLIDYIPKQSCCQNCVSHQATT